MKLSLFWPRRPQPYEDAQNRKSKTTGAQKKPFEAPVKIGNPVAAKAGQTRPRTAKKMNREIFWVSGGDRGFKVCGSQGRRDSL